MTNRLLRPKKSMFVAFLLPGLLLYSFIVAVPIFNAVRFSFYQWSGGPKKTFIGLENFAELLKDEIFWLAFRNNVIITALCVLGQIGIAFILSSLLVSRFLKFKEFHRTVTFFPVILAPVVVGFVWTLIYNNRAGLLNWALRAMNMEGLIRPWLDDPGIILYTVSVPLIWQYIGFYMIILMSAFMSIPKEIFEVAEIDGATGIRKAVYITLPLIRDTLFVTIMLCISGNMKIFDHIYAMTRGGPGNSSIVMAMYAYRNSFEMYKLGYGNAISIGILVLSLALILITRKVMGGRSVED